MTIDRTYPFCSVWLGLGLRIELSMRFIVALLIASFFVDKADSELSFIRRHNLDPCASYSPGVRSQKPSHPCPSGKHHKPLFFTLFRKPKDSISIVSVLI
ncbi:lipid-transfer protein [Striga asiatica]|uniref:Lipid-transfer protein n=1 Tax=Striga asiatica TaxID=4170 RepID=A0A5A7QLK4_STRAF|nr:lipid-transfer protein [Striga asiatica]